MREENQIREKGGVGIESKFTEEYTPLITDPKNLFWLSFILLNFIYRCNLFTVCVAVDNVSTCSQACFFQLDNNIPSIEEFMAMLASYSIKCIFVYILLVSDSTLIHTMKIFVINAMKNIGIFQDISKCHSLERLKGAVNSMEISDIKSKTRDFLILLMNLPKSLLKTH